MFITQGVKPNNGFFNYILGSIIVIAASFIGQLPLIAGIFVKSVTTEVPFPTTSDALMTFLEPNITLFLLLLSFVFAVVGLYFVVRYLHRQPFLEILTSRKKLDWKRIFFAFTIWAVFSVGSVMASYYIDPAAFELNFKPVPFAILAIIAILMIPIQTSAEEFIFRGYLMQGFANLSRNKWFPLVMTSVIFGGMHLANPEVAKIGYIIMVYYIGTGFFLGILTLMDEGMELALGFHAANNLIGALLITSDWSAFQTHSIFKDLAEPSAGFEVILPVVIIFPILLFIFSKKYNWTGWEEKLTGKITENNTNQFNSKGENA